MVEWWLVLGHRALPLTRLLPQFNKMNYNEYQPNDTRKCSNREIEQ